MSSLWTINLSRRTLVSWSELVTIRR